MYLKFAFATFLAAVSTVLAAPQTSAASALSECISISPSCYFDWNVWYHGTGDFLCICSNDQGNGPLVLPRSRTVISLSPKLKANFLPRSLAWFYTGTDYTDFEYQAYGQYGTCYNLPEFWDQKSNSMISASDPDDAVICCVYTAQQCDTDKHDWTPVAANVSEFKGVYKNGVRSFQCSPWINEWSQCTDGWNAPSQPASPPTSSHSWQSIPSDPALADSPWPIYL
jgi:hypothetical protein